MNPSLPLAFQTYFRYWIPYEIPFSLKEEEESMKHLYVLISKNLEFQNQLQYEAKLLENGDEALNRIIGLLPEEPFPIPYDSFFVVFPVEQTPYHFECVVVKYLRSLTCVLRYPSSATQRNVTELKITKDIDWDNLKKIIPRDTLQIGTPKNDPEKIIFPYGDFVGMLKGYFS